MKKKMRDKDSKLRREWEGGGVGGSPKAFRRPKTRLPENSSLPRNYYGIRQLALSFFFFPSGVFLVMNCLQK